MDPKQYQATPQQWEVIESRVGWAYPETTDCCILDLRNQLNRALERIDSLEVGPNEGSPITAPQNKSSGGAQVLDRVIDALNPDDPPCYTVDAATAAIKTVASMLRKEGWDKAALWLEDQLCQDADLN